MGLQDLTLKLTNTEADAKYAKKWIEDNKTALSNATGLVSRVEALENTSISSYANTLKTYAQLFGGNAHGFLFFTDPHNFSDNVQYNTLINYLKSIHTLYANSPAKYVLCGGDLINENHLHADAIYYLSRALNLMRSEICPETYVAVGNHDLNLHGTTDRDVKPHELARMWYEKDVCYFSVDRENTRCFVFDSGSMGRNAMDGNEYSEYRWKQVDWFANELLNNQVSHLYGLMHIVGQYNTSPNGYLSEVVCGIADAFNKRMSITSNGKTYNFKNAKGTFHFMLSGHYHIDLENTISNIPIAYTAMQVIDLCCADWDTHKLTQVRYNSSQPPRVIDMVYTGEDDNALPIYGVSANTIVNMFSQRALENNNGTMIDNINYTGTISITQASASNVSQFNAANGYISIGVTKLQKNVTYRMTADAEITNDILGNSNIIVGSNTNYSSLAPTTIQNGKIDVTFTPTDSTNYPEVRIYLGGISMNISNINFEIITE